MASNGQLDERRGTQLSPLVIAALLLLPTSAYSEQLAVPIFTGAINITSPGNDQFYAFLDSNDRRAVYINTIIDADYAIEEHKVILERCNARADDFDPLSLLDGDIGDAEIHLPTSTNAETAKDFFEYLAKWRKTNPNGTPEDFVEGHVQCTFRSVLFNTFKGNYPTSHGGTGVVRIPFKGFFQVTTYLLGADTTYHLDELSTLEVDLLRSVQ